MEPFLEVWFVNVGHGDSTILKFPSGHVMMVDINNCKCLDETTESELLESVGVSGYFKALYRAGNRQVLTYAQAKAIDEYIAKLDDPIDVLKEEVVGSDYGTVFRFVASHPDMDHLTGLHRLFFEEQGIRVVNFWDTANDKSIADSEFRSNEDRKNWTAYQRIRAGQSNAKVLYLHKGDTGNYWTQDGIVILSPNPAIVTEANEAENWNHLSQVLMVTYGKSRVILPADATVEVQDWLARCHGGFLASSILKAPHHGRESGFCERFVASVNPRYTIVSIGDTPDTDATDSYREYSEVFTTRTNGTIRARIFANGKVELYDCEGWLLNDEQWAWSH